MDELVSLVDDLDPDSPPDAPITEQERKLLRRLRRILEEDPRD